MHSPSFIEIILHIIDNITQGWCWIFLYELDRVFLKFAFIPNCFFKSPLSKKNFYTDHMCTVFLMYVFFGVSSNYFFVIFLYIYCMYTVFCPYVFSGVDLKFHFLKRFWTLIALVRFLSWMCSKVYLQISALWKRFCTLSA